MRLIDEKWKEFYSELEYDKRKEILHQIEAQAELAPEEVFAKELFEARYSEDGEVDNFMRYLLDNLYIYRSNIFKKRGLKLALDVQKNLWANRAEELGETYKTHLYWELRNLANRYLTTGDDPFYNKKFFGTIPSSKEERQLAIVREMLEISFGVAHKVNAIDQMALYCSAVEDTILNTFPNVSDYINDVKEDIIKKIDIKKFQLF
ncbi:MAG: hypothetical protein IKE51_03140 [Solobacterium sp.]|nr:hypothetical protein [Solobacterium sp.]